MSPQPPIHILVVDPDPAVAAIHGELVQRTAGFTLGAVAHTGADAQRELAGQPYDLILLDLQSPDLNGLDLCRSLRAGDSGTGNSGTGNSGVDILVVTAARQFGLVRAAMSFGAVHYLLKPVAGRALQAHLRRYAGYRRRTADSTGPINQHDIDAALALLRPDVPANPLLERAPSTSTLDAVAAHLRDSPDPVTANEVGMKLGISRITARRYLEELTARRLAYQSQCYGASGRPRHVYSWHAE